MIHSQSACMHACLYSYPLTLTCSLTSLSYSHSPLSLTHTLSLTTTTNIITQTDQAIYILCIHVHVHAYLILIKAPHMFGRLMTVNNSSQPFSNTYTYRFDAANVDNMVHIKIAGWRIYQGSLSDSGK